MVTTWLYLSIEIFYLAINVQQQNYEALTRCLPHLKIVLHTTSNIKYFGIIKQYQAGDIKGCLLATTVKFVPFKDL